MLRVITSFYIVAEMETFTAVVHTFEPNLVGQDYIIGDIHGHFDLLEALIVKINFDCFSDRIFATGDLVDRGPASNLVLNWLEKPWFYSVLGNHEQMAIDAMTALGDRERHKRNGGAWFYELPVEEQCEIVARFQKMPLAIEIGRRDGNLLGIIHAELPGWERGLSWSEGMALLSGADRDVKCDAINQALYSRMRISRQADQNIEGVDQIFVGHSTVAEIVELGNVVYMDTGCSFSDGKLSVLNLLSGKSTSIDTNEMNRLVKSNT